MKNYHSENIYNKGNDEKYNISCNTGNRSWSSTHDSAIDVLDHRSHVLELPLFATARHPDGYTRVNRDIIFQEYFSP